MNVFFPEPQNSITALRQVGVAATIPVHVGLLDCGEGCKFCRVGVPEVAVPLDYGSVGSDQHVNSEFPTDNRLLSEGNLQTTQNGAASDFQFGFARPLASSHPLQCSSVSALVGAIVLAANIGRRATERCAADWAGETNTDTATEAGAVNTVSFIKAPARNVELLAACLTSFDSTTATNGCRSLPCFLFHLCLFLPVVGAFQGTKLDAAASARDKCFAAVKACVRATGIAALGVVVSCRKHLPAFVTSFFR